MNHFIQNYELYVFYAKFVSSDSPGGVTHVVVKHVLRRIVLLSNRVVIGVGDEPAGEFSRKFSSLSPQATGYWMII